MSIFLKKPKTSIDPAQKELIENAQARVRQKKRLYRHFVLFLAGAILLIAANLALGLGKEFKPMGKDWFVWAILVWTFFFLVHLINVTLMSSFMNKAWEQEQMDILVTKQKLKIAELEESVHQEMPLPLKKKTLLSDPNLPLTEQNTPL